MGDCNPFLFRKVMKHYGISIQGVCFMMGILAERMVTKRTSALDKRMLEYIGTILAVMGIPREPITTSGSAGVSPQTLLCLINGKLVVWIARIPL